MEQRFEDKYPLTLDSVGGFRYWLNGVQGAAFQVAYPSRVVNSIYFDSPELSSYEDNVEGTGVRRKVRLRWYGEGRPTDVLRFEIKSRSNSAGSKVWFPIPADRLAVEPHRSLARRLRRVLRPDLRTVLDAFSVPLLISRYHREYYATTSGIRLTVDTGMCSRKLVGQRVGFPKELPGSVVAVVEVKYPVDAADEVRRLLASFPLSVSKNSKYAQAVESWI